MIKELAEKSRGLLIRGAGWSRASYPRSRQNALQSRRRMVVKLVVFLRRAVPVPNIRFVPNFPIPSLDLTPAILLYGLTDPLIHQFAPLGVVLRRICPTQIVLTKIRSGRPKCVRM